jgi:sterol desaturase/sphingolipid hydroxylase (fatty acid hydroxylase superfamily)
MARGVPPKARRLKRNRRLNFPCHVAGHADPPGQNAPRPRRQTAMSWQDLLVLAAIAAVFMPLEHLFPARTNRPSWPRIRVDLMHLFLSGAVIRWGGIAVAIGLAMTAEAIVPQPWRESIRAQPDLLEFVEVLLLADLGFYLAHRLFHAIPWLWRFHEIHHSSEQLDWLAAYRVHPVDQIVNSAIIIGPALLLGFSAGPMLAYALLYRWHAILLHSNVKVDFGPLRWVIASPHFHHWHHADQADAYDRNFGGQLVIFDWLFGTLNLRRRGLPEAYGLSPPIADTYVAQLAHPFTRPRPEPALTAAGEHP